MKLVPIDDLREGMILAADVFTTDSALIPLVYKSTVLKASTIRSLESHGVLSAYIVGEPEVREELPPPPPPVISEELRTEAITNLESLFTVARDNDATTAPHLVRELDTVVDQLVETLKDDQAALVNISDLKSYDEYTYHHSLSVAVLSIAIGDARGYSRAELHQLGKCAMLHDIGKTMVPIEITNKPGRLTDLEFSQMKNHAAFGYQYLVEHAMGSAPLRAGVLFHHERMDGGGYPKGLKGGQIPEYSRIITVADVYDALTSNRPYRTPMQPAEAIEYVMGGVGAAFDYDIVKAFISKLELYPVGSFVELSTGEIAAVINNASTLRPVVRVLETGKTMDLFQKYLSVTIARVLQ